MLHHFTVFCFLMTFIFFNGQGQSAENIRSTFKNGQATITYDMAGAKKEGRYTVTLYASYNDFSTPLKLVSGDVGRDIKAGSNRKIEWRAFEETGSDKDEIVFKIRITVAPQPLNFITPAGGHIRRGRTTVIEWQGGLTKGGLSDEERELELYHWEKKVASLGKMTGVWQYTWTVPKDIEKGDGYSVKLVGKNESCLSRTFRIKSRVPLLAKLSPLIVVAAVIPFLTDHSPERSPLPAAPVPE